MTPILGFLLVVVMAFIGSLYISPRLNLANPWVSGLIVSGIPYVLLGLLLGPQISNFLNKSILNSLEPFLSLALGWVGILFGIQLRWKNLKRFPRNYLIITSTQSLTAFAVILLSCAGFFLLLKSPFAGQIWKGALILAALGCVTAPLTVSRAILIHKARGKLTHLIQFIASLDTFWGILAAGLFFSFFYPHLNYAFHSGWSRLLLTVGIAVMVGFLFRFLLLNRFSQEETFLLVLGLVIFTSGIGFYLYVSPIFLNMVVGMVLAQFRRESEKVIRVLAIAEKPIYLILLIFAGALWDFSFLPTVLLILLFLAARFLGKWLGGYIAVRSVDCAFPVPRRLGLVLTSFGGVSLAIAFNYKLFFPDTSGNLIISAAIVGIILFDEFAAWSTLNILKRQGEIS